jgi:hypothetical protein
VIINKWNPGTNALRLSSVICNCNRIDQLPPPTVTVRRHQLHDTMRPGSASMLRSGQRKTRRFTGQLRTFVARFAPPHSLPARSSAVLRPTMQAPPAPTSPADAQLPPPWTARLASAGQRAIDKPAELYPRPHVAPRRVLRAGGSGPCAVEAKARVRSSHARLPACRG